MNSSTLGYWNLKKEKLKEQFPMITDDDLCFREGKETIMMEMLGNKLGKTKDELVRILATLK